MESGVLKIIKWRQSAQCLRMLFPIRAYADLPNLRKVEEKKAAISGAYPNSVTKYWNEHSALKKQRQEYGVLRSIRSSTDLIKTLQDIRNFPRGFKDLFDLIIRMINKRDLINQKFMPDRELVLKPDLAAAHFIVQRGGSVRFIGQQYWVGKLEEKKSLPFSYVPGLHVEAIKAGRANLCYEGVKNLRKLQYLNFISFKDSEGIDDWCLDWVSKEFYASLRYLDISNCKNVTYRGLSCFYRFERLKTLNMEGVPDTPEMKLACLMLLDIMPGLDIKGIDLNVPDKINPVNLEGTKHISEETKQISEETKQVSKM